MDEKEKNVQNQLPENNEENREKLAEQVYKYFLKKYPWTPESYILRIRQEYVEDNEMFLLEWEMFIGKER